MTTYHQKLQFWSKTARILAYTAALLASTLLVLIFLLTHDA